MQNGPIKKGSTDRSVYLYIIDSTDGTPEDGVTYATSGLALSYRRQGATSQSITAVTLADASAAHTDGGFVYTGIPGTYRLDSPDAAFATGAQDVSFGGACTGMIVIPIVIRLVNYDPEDAVRLGLTALPNAAADAAGGLAISDAGGLDLDAVNTAALRLTSARATYIDNLNGMTVAAISDAVWDEVITGATHGTATSAGKRLLQMSSLSIIDGTVVSSTSNTIVLDAAASSVDGAYDPAIVTIYSGTGSGQTRLILQYVGATKTCTIDRDWKVNPDATSLYQIMGDTGREHVNEGAAQGGGANTITLNANASSSDDVYVGQVIFLRSGTGEDQAKRITAYNGTTKVATVESNWTIQPIAGTGYSMLPSSILVYSILGPALADYVLDEVVEGSLTLRQFQRILVSVLAGKVSGAPTGPIGFRDIADTKNRVVAAVDTDGNRTSITLDGA